MSRTHENFVKYTIASSLDYRKMLGRFAWLILLEGDRSWLSSIIPANVTISKLTSVNFESSRLWLSPLARFALLYYYAQFQT